ncbi:MAG: hypothetical protein M5U12_31650 [Verrucomicrobia bacterium]|nr:hypothetical protein [Verrucomicrobiota bacterium]
MGWGSARAAAAGIGGAAARLRSGLAEGGEGAGFEFVVGDGEAPFLLDFAAVGRGARDEGIAIGVAGAAVGVAATVDGFEEVEGLFGAHDDVLAAGVEGVAGLDGDLAVAVVADDLEAADDPPAVEVAVMEAVLGADVVLGAVELGLGEQLAGEEARAFEAFEAVADRAGARLGRALLLDLIVSGRHGERG